jgi:hypothetical protein
MKIYKITEVAILKKECTKCREEKSAMEFASGKTRDGLRFWCKQCERVYQQEFYIASKKEMTIAEHKVCVSCKKEKHHSKFYKQAKAKSGLQSRCRLCLAKEER